MSNILEHVIDDINEEDSKELTSLFRRFAVLAIKGSKSKQNIQYLFEMSNIMEQQMNDNNEEANYDVNSQAQRKSSRDITNGVIEGGESICNISIQNPDRVKSKGRPKKRGRIATIVESAKIKAKKKIQKKQKELHQNQ